jgi:hypothetical protein
LALLDELYVISVDYESLSDDEKRTNGVSVGRKGDPEWDTLDTFFAGYDLYRPGFVKR